MTSRNFGLDTSGLFKEDRSRRFSSKTRMTGKRLALQGAGKRNSKQTVRYDTRNSIINTEEELPLLSDAQNHECIRVNLHEQESRRARKNRVQENRSYAVRPSNNYSKNLQDQEQSERGSCLPHKRKYAQLESFQVLDTTEHSYTFSVPEPEPPNGAVKPDTISLSRTYANEPEDSQRADESVQSADNSISGSYNGSNSRSKTLRCNLADTSDTGRETTRFTKRPSVTLSQIAARQSPIIASLNMNLGDWRDRPSNFFRHSKEPGSCKSGNQALSKEEKWFKYLGILAKCHPDFFSSDDAQMLNTKKLVKGMVGYESLLMSHNNNANILYIFDLEYRSKLEMGHSVASYEQLCMVIGQYIRMCVSLHVIEDPYSIYKPGIIFEAVTEREALQTFFNYFRICGAISTVMTKALHMVKTLEFSLIYFEQTKSTALCGKALAAQRFCRSIRSSSKSLAGRRPHSREI